MGYTIVFKNDAPLNVLKEPSDGGPDRLLAPEILIPKQGIELTVPVGLRSNVPEPLAQLRILGMVGTRPVCRHKEPSRLYLPNARKDSRDKIGTVKYEKKNRFFHSKSSIKTP
jgi:hypothetical protein